MVMKAIINGAETAVAALMSMLKVHINDYCDLETTTGNGNSLVARDGSIATVVRHEGFRSLLGRTDFEYLSSEMATKLEPYFAKRGHMMQVVFIREEDPADAIRQMLASHYESAETLRLDVRDMLDEKVEVHRRLCMDEKTFFVLWSRPTLLDVTEIATTRAENAALARQYNVPTFETAQNLLRPNRFLEDQHDAFVQKVLQEMQALKCAVSIVSAGEILAESKRYLHRETPLSWRPILVGDPLIARWKNNRKMKDASEIMYPRLDDQIFHSPAQNGNLKGVGGVTDTAAVRIGDRLFAPVLMKLAPAKPMPFNDLFRAMNLSVVEDRHGRKRRVPWAISFLIEGDGLSTLGLRKFFATLLGALSKDNRHMRAAATALAGYRDDQNGVVTKMQVTMATWADYPDEDTLMARRRKMAAALMGWGRANVELERGDPTAGLISTAPGLSLSSIAPESAPPLHDVTRMLPITRPASPFQRCTLLLRSLDGKLLPFESFSDEQNTWITLVFGGPGSGKSVFSNRLNFEMCLMAGLKRLPYIGVVDIGVSSRGFVDLVRDSLPENMKHLAMYVRLQNREDYAINQFDTDLGLREPLTRQRELMKNFLVALATPAERGKAHTYMNEFAGRVIDRAFAKLSDLDGRGEPTRYRHNQNAWLAKRVEQLGIEYNGATRWWNIVDAFAAKGYSYEASVAQRYAVPTLEHMLAQASDPALGAEFSGANEQGGQNVVAEFNLMISSAIGEYPLFRRETRFDTGESRVMAIDLQDVVPGGTTPDAKKKATLMYMVALNAFTRKISMIKEDLDAPQMNDRYRAYHAARVDDLAEDRKRLFVDEYHKTGDNPNLRESFLIYGRESRKWLLELVLASQLPEDFRELAKIATTVLVMDQGTPDTRKTIREVFGLSESEVQALRQYVNGPIPGQGATFLAKIKTKTAELSQLFTATSGGLELWGLSTTAEDRRLRGILYEAMPPREARRVLRDRFQNGSCRSYVLNEAARTKEERGESFVDDNTEDTVIEVLAKQLIAQWKADAIRLSEAAAV
ncbi:IcmB protein [Burkholderia pseudomallei]|uniref:IcmB protein n=1 Tax=Burkholderia pseudomallei TaxID=28450 RepID=UPI000A1CC185|nr:IcmB protein [Burkholderia pseudomallei]